MKRAYPTILLLLCCSLAFSQVPGYRGKRVMLKTDVLAPILDRGFDAEAELVVTRRFSAMIGFKYSGKRFKQRLQEYKNINGSFPDQKAILDEKQIGAGIYYFMDAAIPSPKGKYLFARYYYGRSEIEGNFYDQELERLLDYTARHVRSSKAQLGFGYKEIFLDLITLDFNFGVTLASMNASENLTFDGQNYNFVLDGIADNYGPNLGSFGGWNSNLPGGFGLNINLKVGVLLF